MAVDDDFDEGGAGGARPFWSGTITFGLVSVPVSLFAANRPRASVGLRMVTEDGAPLQRRYVCSKDETELDWSDIVRGYEVDKGKFVTVEDEELEAIEPRKSRDIDLRMFVARDDLDPEYFERGYFLTPAGGSNKAYRLLAEVMERTGRAGLATFVMRSKEYVVAILAENGILRAETLRFADEVRTPEQAGLPKAQKPKPADVKKFEKLITTKSRKVDFSEFLDDYAERLEDLAKKKQKKKEDVIRVSEPVEDEDGGGEVIDLMEVLSRSLGGRGGAKKKRAPAKKASSRKKKAS